ncbi:MAG: ATP-dependent zinc metalloprotease FtsH [Patescibacteria group bacterium]|nr:ATP-dependent zinc metalloprotease FtsH [Patescibacteria group bacterium]
MKKNNLSKNILYLLFFILLVALFYTLLGSSNSNNSKVPISTVAQEVKNDNVKSIDVSGNNIDVTLKNGTKETSELGQNESITTTLKDLGADPSKVGALNIADNSSNALLISILGNFLPVILIIAFLYFMFRQAQGTSNQAMLFGKSRARLYDSKSQKVNFKDVAGAQEAKEELSEIVEFLKYPGKFLALGAKIPKGVLLFGAPGTGKTLLARAVAGEADVPFFSISGSEFVEMFVGVGASRVRDLFLKAKKNAPAIIFIDEIDAVGRQRGAGLGGSHDEREQTLNQILVEMDGFEQGTNVIVMAATNRPDVLDPALLRPGRFDRRVVLDMPDIKDREAILEVHARNKPLDKDVILKTIAKITPGFSGADLENLMNEATILTARRDKKKIAMQEVNEAVEKVLLGPEKKNQIITEQEKKITAFHEAGHALVGHLLPKTDPIHKISIISRGMSLGATWSLPKEDRKMATKEEMEQQIAQILGGRAAEKIIFGQETTGAENDLRQATRLARKMVVEYGMSEKLGNRVFGHKEELVFLGRELGEQRDYSDETAKVIDDEVGVLIKEGFETATRILSKYRDKLDKVALKLIKEETIEGEEFEALFDKVQKNKKPSKDKVENTGEEEAPAAA